MINQNPVELGAQEKICIGL